MGKFRNLRILFALFLLLAILCGCASIGNPSGGARDEDPPRFVMANPAPGSVNVDSTNVNITITFDELVNVKNAFEKVVLSPPGKSVPRVSTRGRRVLVTSTDTLLPNTTYTIDFGDAIEDNNESNILSGFSYTFSTGPVLDSLRISGMVLGAEDMEPQQGVFVGAYTTTADSAFLKLPFERLARTDEMGRFIIRGLQDTTYRLFALKDLDNDKHYANPEEDIAWFEDTIRPTSERILTHDTIRNLYNGTIDTIVARTRTRFLPNNILLRMYNTGIKPQYLVSYTRPDSTKLSFIFNAPSEVQPRIKLANDTLFPDPLVAETSIGNDSLTFFLPRELAMRDTLQLAIEYTNTNVTTGTPRIINDTVKLMKPKVEKKKEKKKKKSKKKESSASSSLSSSSPIIEEGAATEVADSIQRRSMATEIADSIPSENQEQRTEVKEPRKDLGNRQPTTDNQETEDEEETPPPPTFKFSVSGPDKSITVPILIEVPVPLASLDTMAFHLEVKTDTVWKPLPKPYRLQRADTLSERRFKIEYPWERGVSYKLTIDSIAGTDIYGVMSDKFEQEFKTKSEDEVSNLKVTLSGLDNSTPAFVQLLESDKPKYTAPVKNGVAEFNGIDGGKYYMRLYEDFNGDGKFTTGSYRMQRVYGEPLALSSLSPIIEDGTVTEIGDSTLIEDKKQITNNKEQIEEIQEEEELTSEEGEVATDDKEMAIDDKEEGKVMTDRERVKQLLEMGYSLTPIETDSVGTDILIAIQPDLVYYYPKQINVKKAWDVEQSWNVFETALDLQKPVKIRKNKPKRTSQQQTQEEEEEDEDDYFGNSYGTTNKKTSSQFKTAY